MFSAGFVSDFHYNEVKCCAGDTLIYVYTNCNGEITAVERIFVFLIWKMVPPLVSHHGHLLL